MKQKDLITIINVATSVGPMITTNLDKDGITFLLSNALTYLNYEVVQNYVPQQNLWYYNNDTDAGSVIAITDLNAQRTALAEFIYDK